MIVDPSFKHHMQKFSIIQKVFNETLDKNLNNHGLILGFLGDQNETLNEQRKVNQILVQLLNSVKSPLLGQLSDVHVKSIQIIEEFKTKLAKTSQEIEQSNIHVQQIKNRSISLQKKNEKSQLHFQTLLSLIQKRL